MEPWGASGLISISSSSPEPWQSERDPHPGWTNIVDPRDGRLVTSLDGWQGLAWSPDGLGLLTAQREGPRGSQLGIWWGPGLQQRIDVGRTSLPVLPRYWSGG